MKLKNIMTLVMMPLVTINCATIVHGTKQKINFVSSPSGASVSIDNENKGTTPVTLKLKRKDDHFVQMSMPGYHPSEISLIQKPDWWILGNALSFGFIGIIVDAADSAMYQLKPEKNASFKNATFKKEENKKGKVLSVTLSPNVSAVSLPTEPQPTAMPQTATGQQTPTSVQPTPVQQPVAQQPSATPPTSAGTNTDAPHMIPASQVPESFWPKSK